MVFSSARAVDDTAGVAVGTVMGQDFLRVPETASRSAFTFSPPSISFMSSSLSPMPIAVSSLAINR